jgi:molybdate transport system permease protein
VSRRAFDVVQAGTLGLALAFFILPLAAIFLRPGLGEIIRQLGSEVVVDALIVSAKTNLIAFAVVVIVGTPAAYLLARKRFRGRDLVVSITELPLVLPPAVAGIGLLAAFGRRGLLGEHFDVLGLQIPFSQVAVVMAIIFVSAPFHIRGAIAAFEAVDADLIAAARTLGAGPFRVFARVAVPLAGAGLGAGATLAFARGLGEFGATIIFAGSFQGRTQTLPLAIYSELDRNFNRALAIGALLIMVSVVILIAAKVVPRWIRSPSTSPFRSATSNSSPG